MSGITPEGFTRPSFDEIRAAIVARMREELGPINAGPESAIGQQVTAQAEREALLWEALEGVYLSQYPASAAGRSLDGAVQLTGITRLPATRTIVQVEVTGDPGTVIPAGSQAGTTAGDAFELVESVVVLALAGGFAVGQMRALETGAVPAMAGTLVNILTPVAGWTGVTNPDDGSTGRPIESDPELRQRRRESLLVTGAGTVEAIRARLRQQVPDVTAVSIIENRSGLPDEDGRPPHSFETVVSGGTDADIAQLLWEVKPAGIETVGDISVVVLDSQGNQQPIRFSRPIPLYMWARITLDPGGSGTFPPNAEELAEQAVVAFGEALAVGDDVIFQALFGPIYAAVPGVESVTITLATSVDPESEPLEFAAVNIDVGPNEIALWHPDRVDVGIVDD